MKKVLALGYFDLFHIGHLNYLKEAKSMGDFLVVGIAPDSFANAPKQKPIISESSRKEIVDALSVVDESFIVPFPISDTANASEWIKSLAINIVACGDGWQNSTKWNKLIDALTPHNIEVSFIPTTKEISSTKIREKITNAKTS